MKGKKNSMKKQLSSKVDPQKQEQGPAPDQNSFASGRQSNLNSNSDIERGSHQSTPKNIFQADEQNYKTNKGGP